MSIEVEPNRYFQKIEWTKKNKGEFDSLLMGASTIGYTPPSYLKKYLPDSKFYNLWVSSVTQYENLEHLKYFISEGYALKNVLLQIDLSISSSIHGHGPKNYQRKLHYDVTNTSKRDYFFEYLTILPLDKFKFCLKYNLFEKYEAPLYYESTGHLYAKQRHEKIKKNHIEYVKNEPSFYRTTKRVVDGFYTKEMVEAVREMVKLARENKINLVLLTTAEHVTTMNSFKMEAYYNMLKELAGVTTFWDFSGYNSITTDHYSYIEGGHYLPSVSKLILAQIFSDKTIEVPEDFGHFVTVENVDSHIEFQKKKYLSYCKRHSCLE